MMSSDPRVPGQQKPRLPKAYTEQQLDFLKSHLPEFERRSHGAVRGDAKKYALEQAVKFIGTFGLPHEFHTLEEGDSRFKEQIYNWFKNTVGRNRRKAEGKPRSVKKGSIDKSVNNHNSSTLSPTIAWNTTPVQASQQQQDLTSYPQHVDHTPNTSSPNMATAQPIVINQMQYGNMHPSTNTPPAGHTLPVMITQDNLREAFLSHSVDPAILANMIQTFVVNNPSHTPLTPVVESLFGATIMESPAYSRDPHSLVQKFHDASRYFLPSLAHAGACGSQAASRALLTQIRKNSIWLLPLSPSTSSPASLSEDMQRIAIERVRRKDHIQWARIHAAALEIGMIGIGDHTTYSYNTARAFSEMVARDAVWENDEAEWVAGIFVLRAIMRTALRGNRSQRDEYADMLRAYEGRWKDIKDEVRQTMATEVLVSAKEELDRLDEALSS